MKKILVIEDNPDVRENTAEILTLANYEVLTAEEGKSGAKMAVEELPDLVICDIMMPELDGYGVLHVLSKNPKTAGIPFIFLTAKAEKSDFRKGMGMGADDYITKPFDETELLEAIEVRLEKSTSVTREVTQDIKGVESFLAAASSFENLAHVSSEKVRAYKKKQIIFHEGDVPNHLFFVDEGKVKTFKINEDGKEFITGLYSKGDFFGYQSLITDNTYSESAETLEDSGIGLISKKDFYDLLFQNREVATSFIKLLSNNLEEKQEQLLHLAYNSVRQRVSEALLNISEKYQETALQISREDLAHMVGTAPESVIRTLSDFKDEGCIKIEGGKIIIEDEEKLRHILNWNF